ncbi:MULTISPECIES: hypothetical protein [Actinomyces]|uniref:hypothetical protein n=1 Tax=Actinomyces TaxID=1654 RepID=UPI000AD783CB|nr:MULTISPECIES: hypothetical protein [Actinomyces]
MPSLMPSADSPVPQASPHLPHVETYAPLKRYGQAQQSPHPEPAKSPTKKPVIIWVALVIIAITAVFFLWRSFPFAPSPSVQETSRPTPSNSVAPSVSATQPHYESTDADEEAIVEQQCSRALKENLQRNISLTSKRSIRKTADDKGMAYYSVYMNVFEGNQKYYAQCKITHPRWSDVWITEEIIFDEKPQP